MHIREIIGNKLSQILHPELDSDIMSLGLIKSININERTLEVMFRRKPNSINCFEKLQTEVKEKLGSSRVAGFKEKAQLLARKYQFDINKTKEDIKNNLPHKIASVIAAMCRLDCEKKNRLKNSIESGYKKHINTLTFVKDKLTDLIKGKYLEVVENLTRDVRIFLGSNAILFLLLLAASFLKPQAVRHLFLPSILLLIATAISSGIYIFGQNWFFTIIYNDYMGFGYVAYIAIIFGFLIDIVFNKARVTTEVINAILNTIGSALSVSPC